MFHVTTGLEQGSWARHRLRPLYGCRAPRIVGMEAEETEAAPEGGPLEELNQKTEAEEEQEEPEEAACSRKRVVPGIVYLGHVPPRFRPLHVRNLLSAYGEVGRVFFQAEGRCPGPAAAASCSFGGHGVRVFRRPGGVRLAVPRFSCCGDAGSILAPPALPRTHLEFVK